MSKDNFETRNNINAIGIDLLDSFSEKEIDGFSHFIACPHFNTDKSIVRLLEILKRDVLSKRKFSEEVRNKVYEKVFSDKIIAKDLNTKQRKRLGAKLTDLTRLTERFLAVEALEENKVYRSDLICKKLLEKKQYLLFNRTVRKEEKILTKQLYEDRAYHNRHFRLAENVMHYLYQTGEIYKKDNIPEVLYYLDMHYFLAKLSHFITMLSQKGKTEEAYDSTAVEITLKLLDLPQYAEHPVLQTYRVIIDLIRTEEEDIYHKSLHLLESNAACISGKDLTGLYGIVINFCVRQIRNGKFDLKDLFNLYQKIEERGLLINEDFVDIIKLKNAVTVGCRVSAFEWAAEIIEKYKSFVDKPIRESVWHYNSGVIHFYQKDYKKALSHFIRTENINADYDINGKVMLLKSFYENDQDYDERTIQKLRSTEKFFKENKHLSLTRKRSYRNFIRILIYLYKFRHSDTKMSLESIKERLNKQEVNSDRNWLLEKIGEL